MLLFLLECIEFLLDNGADLTLTDGHSDGHSALDFLITQLYGDSDILIPLCRLLQAGHPVLKCYTAEVDKLLSDHVKETEIALIHGLKLLFASGFKAGRTHRLTSCYQDELQEPNKLQLKQITRMKIRQHLLQRHFETNLFHLPQKGWKQKQETEIETKKFPKVGPNSHPPCFCFSKMCQKQKQKTF